MRARLEAAGGVVLDQTALEGVEVAPNGVSLTVTGPSGGNDSGGGGGGSRKLTARLVLDCMGHQSPIVRQVRWGARPDGVCLVVGGCASGFDAARNATADVICTVADAAPLEAQGGAPLQMFWEAFPSSESPDSRTCVRGGPLRLVLRMPEPRPGTPRLARQAWRAAQRPPPSLPPRSTYMFTYCDAQPFRPSLLQMFEEYWARLPEYQGLGEGGVDALEFKRLLFAFFPTFKSSPLAPAFDRSA